MTRRLIVAVALAALLLACGLALAAGHGIADETFVVAVPLEFTNIDPQKGGGGFNVYSAYVFQGVIELSGEDYHYVPAIATAWENLDPLHWKFTIREGMKFHNGEPLTAEDVKFSWLRAMGESGTGFAGAAASRLKRLIASIETPDDHTVIFKTKTPEAAFLIQARYVFIVPKDFIQKVGDDEFGRAPVGTGPFMITKRAIGERLVFEAYADYFNKNPEPGEKGVPYIKRVAFRSIPQEQTRIAALEVGEIQGTEVSADQARMLKNNPRIKLYNTHKNQPIYIMFNWQDPDDLKNPRYKNRVAASALAPFRDVRVRRALNHAVDVDALIKNFGSGEEYKTTMLGRHGIGYNPNVPRYGYDPEKARKLLAEAGYPNGFKTKFHTTADQPAYMESLLQYLRNVGISIERTQTTVPVVRRELFRGTLEGMVQWASGLGGPDPAANWFQSGVSFEGTYSIHARDERVDKLVEEQAVEFDEKKRAALIDEVIQIIWRDAWFIPLWEPTYTTAIRSEWHHDKFPVIRSINITGLYKEGAR